MTIPSATVSTELERSSYDRIGADSIILFTSANTLDAYQDDVGVGLVGAGGMGGTLHHDE